MEVKDGLVCVCGKSMKAAKLRFQGHPIDGWQCECGEQYFHPGQSQYILFQNKVRHKEYRTKLGQIRSNLILRIPTELAQALELEKGEEVIIKAKGDHDLEVHPIS